MNDDQMDELLIQAARDYNQPAVVPREEMWAGIAARRGSGTRRSGTRRLGGLGVWLWPSVGVAAAALVAVGVGIGRRLEQPRSVSTLAVRPIVVKPSIDSSKAPTDTIEKALHNETRKTDEAVRRLAQSAEPPSRHAPASRHPAESPSRAMRPQAGTRPSGAMRPQAGTRPSRALAYRLVVLRHLAGTEALIATFRASAKRGEMDAEVAQWARELLGTTRLLEASAAADDPVMKRLLDDLDLVIAQIAQYAARGTYNAEELDLIEQSINQRGVMSKLRSTTASSTTTHM